MPRLSYYDVVLGLLPITAGGIAIEPIAPFAAAGSIALLAHALFVNPPRPPLGPQH